jgi:hypothetical protein
MIQQLIEWMDNKRKGWLRVPIIYNQLTECITKAKELQATSIRIPDQSEMKDMEPDLLDALNRFTKSKLSQTPTRLATEQCKWAVVHKNDTFNTLEDAENTKAGWLIDTTDYVTVKIIEP